ncbi:uncharacterized protein LOC118744536 [Rhagoletis pomonella]|uniref:uncharacterized protein LOC118744536 n=1 Tax=Rhagoletis pomonella TaxID=28610 RepID=UPI001784EA69|nr:uncharacterized protein LOC118744536 [Rhagoletis pomonella]
MERTQLLVGSLALLLITSAVSGAAAQDDLADYTVMNFLQDVQRIDNFEQLVFTRNRNATGLAAFGVAANIPLKSRHKELRRYQNFMLDSTLDESQFVRDLMADLGVPVILMNELSTVTARFYSYNHFPDFTLERKSLSLDLFHHGPIYPQRLGNLQGYKLSFIMSGTDPRLVVYDYKGERIMGGYAGHFLTSFASKHNCTLYEPLPAPSITRFAPAQECVAAVRNGTVDISIGLTFPRMTSDKKFTFDGLTYPYEHANWCAWSPLEPDVPHYEFFWIVFEGLAFALTLLTIFVISIVLSFALWQYDHKPDVTRFFLHDACLRGVLAQSFRELAYAPFVIRFIYLQICILGILLTTSYNAYFAAYWTSAPKEPPFRSFNDILHSNMKVYMFAPEYNELFARAEDLRKYTPMFQIEGDYQRFLRTRDAFNTKYIYMIALSKWKIFREQQKVFTTPLFRMRHDLCLYHNIPLSFPIHSNSIFAEKLNEMILETMESGLIEHWSQTSFLELIRAGRLKFVDLSRKNEFRPMKVEDLKYVWIGYGVMCLVMVLVFVAEQCCYGSLYDGDGLELMHQYRNHR